MAELVRFCGRLLIFLIFLMAPNVKCECMNEYNTNRCWTKAEVGDFKQYMQDGDPCFTHASQRWCFINDKGNMEPCTCTPECGCGNASDSPPAPAAPECDNSKVPSQFHVLCGNGYSKKNTMCKYQGIGKACNSKVCLRELSQEQKDQIVELHNEIRRKVAKGEQKGQPGASNMIELTWDDELAITAQRWTDQCKFRQDKDRTTPSMTSVGQNIAQTGSSQNSDRDETDMTKLLEMWYDEVRSFDSSAVDKMTFDQLPHSGSYTQLVWAKTRKVGCGFIQYQKKGFYWKNLVCNYYPAGNRIGASAYKIGKAGSRCENGSNDGLCQ